MYITFARYFVCKEDDFEEIWRNRATHLGGIKGFGKLNLIKGSSNDEYTLYASHMCMGIKT